MSGNSAKKSSAKSARNQLILAEMKSTKLKSYIKISKIKLKSAKFYKVQ